MMVYEQNALIQKEIASCIGMVAKCQRGIVISNLVHYANYPTTMILCMINCAQKIHTHGNTHQKLREVYIEIIS